MLLIPLDSPLRQIHCDSVQGSRGSLQATRCHGWQLKITGTLCLEPADYPHFFELNRSLCPHPCFSLTERHTYILGLKPQKMKNSSHPQSVSHSNANIISLSIPNATPAQSGIPCCNAAKKRSSMQTNGTLFFAR